VRLLQQGKPVTAKAEKAAKPVAANATQGPAQAAKPTGLHQYWLIKSEPDEYPLEELQAKGQGFWDGTSLSRMRALALGALPARLRRARAQAAHSRTPTPGHLCAGVRNYVARNNMREMQVLVSPSFPVACRWLSQMPTVEARARALAASTCIGRLQQVVCVLKSARGGAQVGDLCFFYHSSCKVPSVVGICEVLAPV
jgi:hypothetical protein